MSPNHDRKPPTLARLIAVVGAVAQFERDLILERTRDAFRR